MIVSRSYWLGLGSGLILSAMLTMVISPNLGNTSFSKNNDPNQTVKQQTSQSTVNTVKSSDSTTVEKPALPTSQTKQSQEVLSPSSVIQTEQSFVIPEGSSADRIADLLLAQGFIKDKTSFLVSAHQLGADNKFRAGTFTLALGLTSEELIHRLLKTRV